MPAIIKKIKKGKAYYYATQSGRVNGKPRIIWQKYLGSVSTILKRFEQTAPVKPCETVLFEAGGVAALLGIANKLGIIDLINECVPKKDGGPSVGHYIVLAALNRALDPTSKLQIGDWYRNTVLQRLWGFPSKVFTSQSYWNHMDMMSLEAIRSIQDRLTERVRQQFRLDTDVLLYDTTNFFTYIDSYNDRNTVAQRGRQKQKRNDLRQVNLALVTTRDFQIPLFHMTYPGNIPDVKFFPEVTQKLLKRHTALFGPLKKTMLVFDRGNLSDDSLEKLLYSGTHFIAGVKADLIPEAFKIPIEKFQTAAIMPGTKIYEMSVEVCGQSCKAFVSYSESFFTQQLSSLTVSMAKCEEKLKALLKSLTDSILRKKSFKKGKRPTKRQAQTAVKNILSGQHMSQLFTIDWNQFGLPLFRYHVNREKFDDLVVTRLGRALLLTNQTNLLPDEAVMTYRDLNHIEEAFKNMKNRDYLRWQPAFHWTDQKLEVHSFYCVLALLLTTLARKSAHEVGIELSLSSLLDELSGIREVALLYTQKGTIKTELTLNRMSPRQKKLADLFEIGNVLEG
jgi:transposase